MPCGRSNARMRRSTSCCGRKFGPRWRISDRAFRLRMSSAGSRRDMRARRKLPSVAHKVFFRRRAEDRLTELYDYIAGQSSPQTAIDYVARIRMACMAPATFPERGRRRDDILPGLRVIGFERRVTIPSRPENACRDCQHCLWWTGFRARTAQGQIGARPGAPNRRNCSAAPGAAASGKPGA